MDTEENSDDQNVFDGSVWKLLKQILGRLKDWAPLSVIALYILGIPVSIYLKNAVLAYVVVTILSFGLMLLRGLQMGLDATNQGRKIDAERKLKLLNAQNAHAAKLARIANGHGKSIVPIVSGQRRGGQTAAHGKKSGS